MTPETMTPLQATMAALPGVEIHQAPGSSVWSASRPDPNPSEEGKAAAALTHAYGEDSRCLFCDCRPWGTWAEWPCTG
jgi:hypothetical protein